MLIPKTKYDLVLGCGYEDVWIEFAIEKGRTTEEDLESAESQFALWLEDRRKRLAENAAEQREAEVHRELTGGEG